MLAAMRGIRVAVVTVMLAWMPVSLAGAAAVQDPSAQSVHRFALTGTVDPLVANGVERAVQAAVDKGQELLIRIDTPGGLDSAMRRIVKAIERPGAKVTCWVGPSGARAASAGAFILIGCPRAAMAPGTNVGAAHPVGFRGEFLGEKVTNDAAAYIRALAERNGRNAEWAERAVRDSASITASEALRIDVIDQIAASEKELYGSGARFKDSGLTPIESLLHNLIDPNLAFLFFLLGAGLIVFEFFSPGGFGAVLGVVFFAAALVMLGMLPVNLAGIVLLLAAMVLFAIEAQAPGVGFPTAGAVTCVVLGGLFLFDASIPNARVSRPLVGGAAITLAVFFAMVVQAAVKARKMPAPHLVPVLGAEGVVVRTLDPDGVVAAGGEQWGARTVSGSVEEGARVRVVAVEGLTLTVEPASREIGE